MARSQRDIATGAFTVISWNEDYDVSSDGTTAVMGDWLGTLCRDLINQGIVAGTVSA